MKINFIVPEITRTGGMNIIFQYANRLLERGHDVELYSPIIPFNLHKNGIRWYYFKYQVKSLLKWLRYGRGIIPKNMYPYKFKINFVPIMLNTFVRDADVLLQHHGQHHTLFIISSLQKAGNTTLFRIMKYGMQMLN